MTSYYDRFISNRARRNGINWISGDDPLPPVHRRNLDRLGKEIDQHLQAADRAARLRQETPVVPGDSYQRQEVTYMHRRRVWLPRLGWLSLLAGTVLAAYALGSAAVVGDIRDVLMCLGMLALMLGVACLARE